MPNRFLERTSNETRDEIIDILIEKLVISMPFCIYLAYHSFKRCGERAFILLVHPIALLQVFSVHMFKYTSKVLDKILRAFSLAQFTKVYYRPNILVYRMEQ